MAGAAAAPGLVSVASGLESPVFVTSARDGSQRLFIVEQGGTIKVLRPGAAAPSVFLRIGDRVLSGGEQGLLGLAFHPRFASNRRFFVNYTRRPDGATVIAEYLVSATDPDVAERAETVLLVDPAAVCQPQRRHGRVRAGRLPLRRPGRRGLGQRPRQPRPERRASCSARSSASTSMPRPTASPYSSPPDNPFAGPAPGRDEIYAVGLRNPFRFSFDRATGELYAGDVGQNAVEEIDIVVRGGNYGWRIWEGTRCTGIDPARCDPRRLHLPRRRVRAHRAAAARSSAATCTAAPGRPCRPGRTSTGTSAPARSSAGATARRASCSRRASPSPRSARTRPESCTSWTSTAPSTGSPRRAGRARAATPRVPGWRCRPG